MKIEFSSQRREMLLFLTTNMSAVTSRANQQYSVPPSEGYQNPSEESHLQVKNKHLLLRDANLLLRDSMFVILGCLFPYALIIERFLIFKEQIKRSLKEPHIHFPCRSKFFIRKFC